MLNMWEYFEEMKKDIGEMEVVDLLDKLYTGGAFVMVYNEEWDIIEKHILGYYMLRTDPQAYRWCSIFPDSQRDAHQVQYDEILNIQDRAVLIILNGKLLLYIAYLSDGLDPLRLEHFEKWKDYINSNNNKLQMERFLMSAFPGR